jgi:hypothetical protein
MRSPSMPTPEQEGASSRQGRRGGEHSAACPVFEREEVPAQLLSERTGGRGPPTGHDGGRGSRGLATPGPPLLSSSMRLGLACSNLSWAARCRTRRLLRVPRRRVGRVAPELESALHSCPRRLDRQQPAQYPSVAAGDAGRAIGRCCIRVHQGSGPGGTQPGIVEVVGWPAAGARSRLVTAPSWWRSTPWIGGWLGAASTGIASCKGERSGLLQVKFSAGAMAGVKSRSLGTRNCKSLSSLSNRNRIDRRNAGCEMRANRENS